MSTNDNNHNHNNADPPTNGGNGSIDPCSKRIREEAEYSRQVRCKNCKLVFCIIASIAVATAAILMISGAVAIWPAQEDDENPPLILTIPTCCQDNNDNGDDDHDDDDRDRDYKHKHKDKHHNDNDDD